MISSNVQEFNQNQKTKPITLVGNWQEQGVQHKCTNAELITPKNKLSDQFLTTAKLTLDQRLPMDEPSVKNGIKVHVKDVPNSILIEQIKQKMRKGSGDPVKQKQFENQNVFEKTTDYQKVFQDEQGNEHVEQKNNDVPEMDKTKMAGQHQDSLYKNTNPTKSDFKYKKLLGDNMAPAVDNETSIGLGRGQQFKDRKTDYKHSQCEITKGTTNNELQVYLRK